MPKVVMGEPHFREQPYGDNRESGRRGYTDDGGPEGGSTATIERAEAAEKRG